MRNVVYLAAAAVGWTAFIYKMKDLRQDRDNPVLRALCLALLFPAVAFTTATPMLFNRIDRIQEEPELAKLLVHGSLVTFSALVQRLLLLWSYPLDQAKPRMRLRTGAAGIVLVVMAVLFVLGPVDQRTEKFAVTYATTPYIAEYLLVYLGAVAVGLVEIGRLCWIFGRATDQIWLRRGLRITAVGATVAMGYCVGRGVYVIGRNLGVDLHVAHDAAPAFAAAGAVLTSVGLTLPAWGPNTTRFTEAVRRIGHYRRLRDLWLVLYRLKPDIAMDESASKWWAPWWPFRGRRRIYRLVIEIHDGMLALQDRSGVAVAALATSLGTSAGLHSEELEATVQAAVLRAALTNPREYVSAGASSRVASGDGSDAPGSSDALPDRYVSTREGTDLASEVEWFLKVARAYRQSPVVRAAADHAVADHAVADAQGERS